MAMVNYILKILHLMQNEFFSSFLSRLGIKFLLNLELLYYLGVHYYILVVLRFYL